MKKIVPLILVICLIVGLPLMVMDALSKKNVFNIPKAYSKIEIDLGEEGRNGEVVFSKILEGPRHVYLYMQSDSKEEKTVTASSDKKFIGKSSSSNTSLISEITGNSSISPSFIADSGTFSISVTNVKAKGKLVIGFMEEPIEKTEFDRLLKIDAGDLNNPPVGYEKVYQADLSDKNCTRDVIYRLKLDQPGEIGLSAYTNARKGKVSIDLVGGNSDWTGLIHNNYNSICDKFSQILPAGEYEVKLTSENADGQIYVFIKK